MQVPHTNPVGLTVVPSSYSQRPQRHPLARRVVASFLLAALFAVVSVTTATSLGAYCLTTDTINTTSLPANQGSTVP